MLQQQKLPRQRQAMSQVPLVSRLRGAFIVLCALNLLYVTPLRASSVVSAEWQESTFKAPLNLAVLIDSALQFSPQILAVNKQLLAAENRMGQAASLPDPRIKYGRFIEPIQTKTGAQQQSIGVSQTLPWFGKLDARVQSAGYRANAVEAELQQVQLNVITEIKLRYYDYAYLAEAITLTKEHLQLLNMIEQISSTKFSSQTYSQQALMQVQIEQAKLENQLQELQEKKQPFSQRIYSALGIASKSVLPFPRKLSKASLPYSDDLLKMKMLKSNPGLIRQTKLLLQAGADIKQKQLDYYPDVTFGLDYFDVNEGKDPVAVSISIKIPIWQNKLKSAEKEVANRYQSIEQIRQDLENRLISQFEMLVYQYRDTQRKINLYQDTILPKSQQVVELSQRSFETGKAGLIEFLNALRSQLDVELAVVKYIADTHVYQAQLESLVGFNSLITHKTTF